MKNIDREIRLLKNHMFAPRGQTGVTPARAREAAQAVIEELRSLRAIVGYIDAHAPRADNTCKELGITLSEAARRTLAELDRAEFEGLDGGAA